MDISARIKLVTSEIFEVLKKFKNPAITCSYGKDSILVVWFLRRLARNIPIVFSNTGFEYPELYAFRRQIIKDWNLTEHVVLPKHTFWWIVERHGFPMYSKGRIAGYDRKFLPAHYCCLYLKKRPFNQFFSKSKFDLVMDGLRAQESDLRRYTIWKYGNLHYSKQNKIYKFHPISKVTNKEREQIYEKYKIPYCKIYDYRMEGIQNRTGCWCCTLNWKYPKGKFLRTYYPRLWKILLDHGFASACLSEKLQSPVSQEYAMTQLETRPCLLDQL